MTRHGRILALGKLKEGLVGFNDNITKDYRVVGFHKYVIWRVSNLFNLFLVVGYTK